jgi:putative transposase
MEKIQKAFKFRIYPNEEQKIFLAKQFGAVRFTYNHFLAKRKEAYLQNKKSSSYYDDAKALTDLKSEEEFSWLYDINSQTLQASLRNLDTAYVSFFRGLTKFPKFHSKKNNQSIKIPQGFSIEGNTLYIPKLKSGIRIKQHREISGKKLSCFISKTAAGKYHLSVACEIGKTELPKLKSVIGIDLGIKSLVADSNGRTYSGVKRTRGEDSRRAFLQRDLSKKMAGSKSREKARLRLAKNYEKERNKRIDNLHKISRSIVNENQVIIAESLSVKKMMMNGAKSLSKSIGESAWSELLRQIEYKSGWAGRTFHKIDRFFPSSKTCNCCRFVTDSLPLGIRSWTCPSCNSDLDRDFNAAKNILEKGLLDLGLTISAGFRNEILSQKLLEATSLEVSEKAEATSFGKW